MALVAAGALAENDHPTTDTLMTESQMGEVVVVSSIKEKGLTRQQPSSVSLVTGRQMNDLHITSLKGVSSLSPNFFMPDYGSRLTSAIYIRGIGSRINTPAVGMYVDNVPYADKSAFDFNLYGIERIDILRGPQGTLYGRNAMGGIVKVETRNPFRYEGTDLQLGIATADLHRNASLTHYHRFGDRFALSAGGYYEGSSGYFDNAHTGKKADGMESGGGRLRGILRANDRLTLDASVSYDYSDEHAYPYFYTGQLKGQEAYPELVGQISANHEGRYRRSLLNGGLNLEYKANTWQMNAVTGYQHLRDRMFMDQDFLSADIYTLEQKQHSQTLSEEVTFKSTRTGRFYDWVAGFNFMYQWLNTQGPVQFYEEGAQWLASMVNSQMPDVSTIPSLQRMGFSSMQVNFRNAPFTMGGCFDTPSLNTALFHQSTFHITPQLSAALGLRLDLDYERMHYNAPSQVDYGFTLVNTKSPMMQVDLQNLSSQLRFKGRLDDLYLNVMPKFSLKYDFNKTDNLYFSIGKGMRSGGYNVQMFSDLLQNALRADMMTGIQGGVEEYLQQFVQMGMPPTVIASVVNTMKENMPQVEVPTVEESVVYKPEYSWTYELGTHFNLFGDRLQADAALFYQHTRDQQIARFAASGMGRMMVNAGKSESYGAELSLRYMPSRHFTLAGSYGYTHAKFTEYDGGKGIDYSGNYIPFVPQHTVHADAAYTWFFQSRWARSLSLGATYQGAGRIYWTEANDARQSFYSLLGARLSMQLAGGVGVTLWGKNLTDTDYDTFYFESVNRGFAQRGKPLQVGIDLRVNF